MIQYAPSIDEELRFVVEDVAGLEVLDFESPDAVFAVPRGVLNLMLKLDILVNEVVLVVDTLKVLPDLRRVRVEVRPELDLPAELVVD